MNLFAFLVGSAALFIKFYSDKYRQDDLTLTLDELDKDDNLPRIRTYDFIIVGGGGAGCVLANRLSLNYNVLLLEAGGTPPPATRSQIFFLDVIFDKSLNYFYSSIPQKHTALENDGVMTRPAGKMLGGSTSHNALAYNRGSPLTYDEWAKILNDASWTYKNVLKYFKRSENYVTSDSPGQQGHGGLLTVDRPYSPILPTWMKAGKELGFRTTFHPNGPQMESFSSFDVTKKNGRRVSTYTAFIQPIEKSRKNLRIERYSFASKILINDKKRAYGVAYTRHGIPQIAHASKEVIISCGAFGSPILLMKSGIGPANTLKEAMIPPVANLPVGESLYEHFSVRLTYAVNAGSLVPSYNTELSEDSLNMYHKNGDGIFGNTLDWAQAFVVSSRAKHDGQFNWTDLQIVLEHFDPREPPKPGNTRFVSTSIGLGRPRVKGIVSLNHTAYRAGLRENEELAVIDYKFLSDPSDVDVLLEGIKLALRIMENTTSFQELGTKYIGEKHPGCSKFKFRTDEYWRCYIRQIGDTYDHPSGTCKMGSGPKYKSAVLDSKFNVLGISNLKVVDASAMPRIPNANLAAVVIMMAEKASVEILNALSKRELFNVSGASQNIQGLHGLNDLSLISYQF